MKPQKKEKEIVQHLEKLGINVDRKKHFKTVCKSSDSRTESKHDSKGPNGARKNRCSHRCNVRKIHEDECHEDSSMEDLTEQVQSLFLCLR